jgi:hypothetical protein
MTIIVATPKFVVIDTIMEASGIEFFTHKLNQWDEDSILGCCGALTWAEMLVKAIVEPEGKMSLDVIRERDEGDCGVYTYNNDLYIFDKAGACKLTSDVVYGSLQTPYFKAVKQITNNYQTFLLDYRNVLRAVRTAVTCTYPNMINEIECEQPYAQYARKEEGWTIKSSYVQPL